MKLAKLFTIGFVALSIAGAAHAKAPMQVTEKEPDSKVESPAQIENLSLIHI